MKKRKLMIIFNPVSGRGISENTLAGIIKFLQNANYKVELLKTTKKGDAASYAGNADSSISAVISTGGDGTINEIVNGLQLKKIPIGLIPGGTGNVLARELGIPLNPLKACKVISKNKMFTMDLGYNFEKYFTLMAGIGIDAEVVRTLSSNRKGNISFAHYGLPIAKTILNYSFKEMKVEVDGKVVANDATNVFIANVKGYFGPVKFGYLAKVNDGKFDVCIIKAKSKLALPKYILGAVTRTLRSFSDVKYLRANEVKVTSNNNIHYQIDGDNGGVLPARFRIEPNAVRFLVP